MTIDSREDSFSVTILADSLPSSGLGHARRCLALGRELEAFGVRVFYTLLADSDTGIFKDADFSPTCLPPNPTCQEITRHLEYSGTSMLVIDTYLLQRDIFFELIQHDPTLPILAFDDHGEKAGWPILGVLNPGLGADMISYPGCFALTSAIGPRYMPLPSECLQTAPRQASMQGKQAFDQNILVVMGASDPERQTLRLARIFLGMNESFVLHIVAGPQYSPIDELLDLCRSNARVRLHVAPKNFHSLAVTCDLAVIGAGLTVSELLYLRVPVAALTLADNQEPTANALERFGLGINLGPFDRVDDRTLAEAFHRILSIPETLDEMTSKARKMVDGKGAARLAAHLLAVWGRYQGKGFSTSEVAAEYQVAFSHTKPHEKVLWGSRDGMENRYLLALKLLDTLDGTSWLDVGSGTGDFLLAASKAGYRPRKYIGIDLSPELTEYARKRCLNLTEIELHFSCQDFIMPISGEPFALVTCLGVLQKCGIGLHQAVERLAELTQPGGRLLISTKNLDWIAFDDPAFTPYPGHHWFKLAQLRDAIFKAGLQIVHLEGYEPRAGRMIPANNAHSVFILARKSEHD